MTPAINPCGLAAAHREPHAAWAGAPPLSKGACVQGAERSMLLEEVNGYKRALQHQALAKAQFGAPHPPGFSVQARCGCRPCACVC